MAAGLAVAAYLFAVAGIALSYRAQGNAPMTAAALGLCSIVTVVSSLVYGGFSFSEKEKNYLLAKISLVAAGLLAFFWAVVIAASL